MDTRYPGFGYYIPVPSLDPRLFSWVLCFPNHLLFFPDKIRYLTMTDSSKVWMPDTFFRNEKIGRFHNILQPNLYVRVFPNGDVLYSIRVSLTCACSMHLALFPLDKQTCNLDVASCKYFIHHSEPENLKKSRPKNSWIQINQFHEKIPSFAISKMAKK